MKNSLLILLFTCLFLNSKILRAQDADPSKIRIGISASLESNLSSEMIFFSDVTGFSADYDKFNYRIGADLEYFLNSNFTINTAINYSNKDFTGTYFCFVCDFIQPPNPETSDFRYIEVPMTMKYYFLPNKTRLFGEAGLNSLFALNNLELDARVNNYVLGLKLGAGVEYNFSQRLALQLKVDHNRSISKVLKDSDFGFRTLNVGFGILKRL
ncbi:outer membrane beta-barrel protein [Spongiivirga citrea]|uniref:Outer membrane beta-barrel protein n=1 Tax=Spongiivirga citrea TaxID=1481457 RepID=A0A6M0CK74_9FLAO|nr:outer membrane beta-barrel protein [Spongiivirga citrea]NER18346.1 outer membrane beta-barrel protein [Spongiivirga citrea]